LSSPDSLVFHRSRSNRRVPPERRRIPIKKATPSASGKTLVVASTRGNQKTAVQIDGRDLYLGVNADVYAEAKTTK
jgi:hypothetical protein